MSGSFEIIKDCFAVVMSGGVYRQVDLYERCGLLYSRYGGGFVKIYASNNTSCEKVRIIDICGIETKKNGFYLEVAK